MKIVNSKDNTKIVEKILKEDCKLKVEKLYKKYKSSEEGVSVVDVDDKIEEFGKNIIEIKDQNTVWHRLKEAIINPFNVVLMIVAVITFITDVVIAVDKDYATFFLIVGTVLISAIISFNEQTKSNNAARKLKQMITNKMDVIRDGNVITIDIE